MDKSRENTISSVTVAGALVNLALSALKLVAGIVGASAAMVADAVHSLSDLVSDVVVLVMVRISSKEIDDSHDYGHGKFETLATVCVSLLLLVVGARLMYRGIKDISFVLDGGELHRPGMIAFWAAIVSIAAKEALFHWTRSVGKKVDSQVMIANAWHHRSDALSSVGAALGIGGAILLGGRWTVLDPVVGCIISIVLIVVAVKMAIPAVAELTEASLPEETEKHITEILEAVPGIRDAHNLQTRRTGPAIVIDVHVLVDAQMSVAEAHELTEKAEEALRSEYGGATQISIHVEPYG